MRRIAAELQSDGTNAVTFEIECSDTAQKGRLGGAGTGFPVTRVLSSSVEPKDGGVGLLQHSTCVAGFQCHQCSSMTKVVGIR